MVCFLVWIPGGSILRSYKVWVWLYTKFQVLVVEMYLLIVAMQKKTHSNYLKWWSTPSAQCREFKVHWVQILKLASACRLIAFYTRWGSFFWNEAFSPHFEWGGRDVMTVGKTWPNCHSLARICLQPAATFHSVWKGVWHSDESTVWLICRERDPTNSCFFTIGLAECIQIKYCPLVFTEKL